MVSGARSRPVIRVRRPKARRGSPRSRVNVGSGNWPWRRDATIDVEKDQFVAIEPRLAEQKGHAT